MSEREVAATGVHVPERLAGRYEILGLIGVGGMGAVYRARDTLLDEPVALKMLRRELVESGEALARFRQEVRLARRVTHQNVARTYDIGEDGDHRFLTMELIDGESLSDLIAREAPTGVARAIELITAVCAGLAAAHDAGVVHRDLKPDNVLVARDGRVVLTDFGIARVLDASVAVTFGVRTGTPAYMAPEQVEASAVDARADVYAAGELLYELLTGQRAWPGDSVYQVAAARLLSPPPDPRFVRPDLPPAVAAATLRAMARRPDERFASAAELAACLHGLTLPFEPVPRAGRPPSERPPAPTPLGKALAVLPFHNLGSPADDYLAAGLTEDLIDTLSMTDGLRVRPLGAVRDVSRDRDPRHVGAELGVQVVIDGSMRRVGDLLRVSARVVGVADGFQLWARRFECGVGDVLRVADEIADALASAMTVPRAAADPRGAPSDPEALALYLEGRHELHKHFSPATDKAIELFARALERAPEEPSILASFALAHLRRFGVDARGDEAGDLAEKAAEHAMALAPELPEAIVALAGVKHALGEEALAARLAKRAVTLGPSQPDACELYGRMAVRAGATDEGIKSLVKAIGVEPRIQQLRSEIGRFYAVIGEHDRSDQLFAAPPSDHEAVMPYWVQRTRVLLWRRDRKAAERLLADTTAAGPQGPAIEMLRTLATGQLVRERMEKLSAFVSPGKALARVANFSVVRAEIFLTVGAVDDALAALKTADEARSYDITWFERCPLLDGLRERREIALATEHVAERAARVREELRRPSS